MTSSWLVQVFYVVILTVSVQSGARTAELMTSHPLDGDIELEAVDRHLQTEVEKVAAEGKLKMASVVDDPCAESEQAMARETRKWGEKSMSAWGKRDDTDMQLEDGFLVPDRVECNQQTIENGDSVPAKSRLVEKRKWGENTMQVWGKRTSNQQNAATDKRKWGEKTMSAWGKRKVGVFDTEDEKNAMDKRKSWGSNTMQVWGKRTKPVRHGSVQKSYATHELRELGVHDENQQPTASSLHLSKVAPSASDSVKPAGGYWGPKRKWETNVMKVWGKRTVPSASVRNEELGAGNEY